MVDKEIDGQLLELLKMVAPGMPLRASLDQIIESKNGALIVVGDSKKVMDVAHGGFKLGTEFTSIKLYELAKMDGAIILSSDCSEIVRANVHMVPDLSMPSSETGMRQRTAGRVAQQCNIPVISISEELGSVFLYVGKIKYILVDIRVLLARADQALHALETSKMRLDRVTASLDELEIEDLVTLEDVAAAVQRYETVERITHEINRCIIELGDEGRLVKMQMNEMTGHIKGEHTKLIKDYSEPRKGRTVSDVKNRLRSLSTDELLELSTIAKALGYGKDLLQAVHPRGYRLLSRIPRLPEQVVDKLVVSFRSLSKIVNASAADLSRVEGVGDARVRILWEGLRRLSEANSLDKYY